jgi:hypothetical protein
MRLMLGSRISRRLENSSPAVFATYVVVAAFGTYFCMYAFRKPFTAGTFEDVTLAGIGYKSVLVIAQVLGYTVSKFIGIKVISEMPPHRRALGILLLIGIAQVALLLFGIVPPPYNFILLFLNGLPLGLIFGLVLGFLEGRQLTEALTAGLCASFIISSGAVKSVGQALMIHGGVGEYWMPFSTGLLFLPPLLFFVWMLAQIPPPNRRDVELRAARPPMRAEDRRRVLRSWGLGLILLVVSYTLLTVVRSLRDDFAVEIWRDLGYHGQPAVFTQSETLVMFGVVLVNGAAFLIRDNHRALLSSLGAIGIGFVTICLAAIAHLAGWLSPFPFMVAIGIGTYVPYVAYHTTLFERLIAVFRDRTNIGYLMYLADAVGYLGYVGVILLRNFGTTEIHFLSFFLQCALLAGGVSLALTLWSTRYFVVRMRDDGQPARPAMVETSLPLPRSGQAAECRPEIAAADGSDVS